MCCSKVVSESGEAERGCTVRGLEDRKGGSKKVTRAPDFGSLAELWPMHRAKLASNNSGYCEAASCITSCH